MVTEIRKRFAAMLYMVDGKKCEGMGLTEYEWVMFLLHQADFLKMMDLGYTASDCAGFVRQCVLTPAQFYERLAAGEEPEQIVKLSNVGL